jgi:hypothetical protein
VSAVDKNERLATVVPFCECMHRADYEGGKPLGECTLAWRFGEFDVLDSEDVYVAVAGHRTECLLAPELKLGLRALTGG